MVNNTYEGLRDLPQLSEFIVQCLPPYTQSSNHTEQFVFSQHTRLLLTSVILCTLFLLYMSVPLKISTHPIRPRSNISFIPSSLVFPPSCLQPSTIRQRWMIIPFIHSVHKLFLELGQFSEPNRPIYPALGKLYSCGRETVKINIINK